MIVMKNQYFVIRIDRNKCFMSVGGPIHGISRMGQLGHLGPWCNAPMALAVAGPGSKLDFLPKQNILYRDNFHLI